MIAAVIIAHACIAAPVTVADHLGAPAIHIDGEPVVPMMFFGIPQGQRITAVEVGPEWREYHVEFVPNENNQGMGGIQIRVGGGPAGTVWVDDCEVYAGEYREGGANMLAFGGFEGSEAEVGEKWTLWTDPGHGVDVSWSLDATDPVEGHQALRMDIASAGSNPMHAHLLQTGMDYSEGETYTYSLKLRSAEPRTVEFFALRQGGSFQIYGSGGSAPYGSQVSLAAGADVHIHSFTIPMPWPQPGAEYDWSGVDAAIDWTIEADPEAYLLPRFGLNPPGWWYAEHPEAIQVFSDGNTQGWSMASEAWRDDVEVHVRELVRHCEEKYGDHMLGYHPAGQNTGEWFYFRSWERVVGDYSQANREGYRRWLDEHYGPDHGRSMPPGAGEQRRSGLGMFRDPQAEARTIDYLRYQQDCMVEPLERLARAIKEETNGERLAVFFYGYTFELFGLPWGPAKSGHYALERLLRCPDVDILCSPISYQDRQLGGSGHFMTAVDSIAAAGKLWLVEDDSRTHMTPPEESFPGGSTLEETRWIHIRQFGHLLPRRLATWYMDLGATGWLDDPGIWTNLSALRAQYEEALSDPPAWQPEVAVIVDEDAAFYGTADWSMHRSVAYEMRVALARMGAPQRWHLLSDLTSGRVPSCKAYILLNCYHLGAEERAAIAGATDGAAAIWMYGGGLFAGDEAPVIAAGAPQVTMSDATGLPIIATEPRRCGDPLPMQPWFDGDPLLDPFWTVAEEPGVQVLTRLDDGTPAISLAETDAGLRAYIATMGCTAADLRELVRRSGVHIYTESDDMVLTDGDMLCVSAMSEGTKRIQLERLATVTDALTGEVVAEGADSLTLDMREGEARLFWLS